MIMSSLSTECGLDWGLFWVNEMTMLPETFCFWMTPQLLGIGLFHHILSDPGQLGKDCICKFVACFCCCNNHAHVYQE